MNEAAHPLYCNISHCIAEVPVVTSCHHTYDIKALEVWLNRETTCPVCRRALSKYDIYLITSEPSDIEYCNKGSILVPLGYGACAFSSIMTGKMHCILDFMMVGFSATIPERPNYISLVLQTLYAIGRVQLWAGLIIENKEIVQAGYAVSTAALLIDAIAVQTLFGKKPNPILHQVITFARLLISPFYIFGENNFASDTSNY